MNTAVNPPPLAADLRAGLRLETLSLGWMTVEAAVSLGAGLAAGSLLLLAFGADSVIEMISAAVLWRRLWQQSQGRLTDERVLEAAERKAARLAGGLLYALSACVVAQALWGLTHRHHAQASFPGIIVATVAALGMPILARAKLRVAERIGSRALRADAMESLTCGYLSWLLLAGLAANALWHGWWLDSVASLVIVPWLLKEAREAVTGECGCREG